MASPHNDGLVCADLHDALMEVPSDTNERVLWVRDDPGRNQSDWSITIRSEDGSTMTYLVHKWMLAFGPRRCLFFAGRNGFSRTDQNDSLQPEEAEVFPIVLDFIYSSEEKDFINSNNVMALRSLGLLLQCKELVQLCNSFIEATLDLENALAFLRWAARRERNDCGLKKTCRKFICRCINRTFGDNAAALFDMLAQLPIDVFCFVMRSPQIQGSLEASQIAIHLFGRHPNKLSAKLLCELTHDETSDALIAIAPCAARGFRDLLSRLDSTRQDEATRAKLLLLHDAVNVCDNILYLKDDVIWCLFAFCNSQELDSIAVTCSKLKDVVEAYANEALKDQFKNLKENYNVDSEWHVRVQQHLDQQQERAPFQPIASRHKLRSAMQVRLYKKRFETRVFIAAQDTIITGGRDGSIRKWDLKTRECIQIFSDSHDRPIDGLALWKGYIVSVDKFCVKKWSMSGECVLTIPSEHELRVKMPLAIVDRNLFCFAYNHDWNECIAEIELPTGEVTRHDVLDKYIFWSSLFAAGNWLILSGSPPHQVGVLQLLNAADNDLSSLGFTQDKRYLYTTLACSDNFIVASEFGGCLDILPVTEEDLRDDDEEGYLECFRFFPVPWESDGIEAMLVHGSHIYVASSSEDGIYVIDCEVYKVVQKLQYTFVDGRPLALATNGHELFCSLKPHDSSVLDHDCIIVSFPLAK